MEFESALWRAATGFGLCGLARAVEFAVDAGRHEEFDPEQHMLPSDVRFPPGGMAVRMRKRKDLKVLSGKHATVVFGEGGTFVDAVADMRRWLRVRREHGVPEDRPLFCHRDGSAITTEEVRQCVRSLMAAAGRDPALYGGHSLRIGGASAALAAGVSPQLIRLMGRWSSDIYEIYCRISLEAAMSLGRSVGSATVTSVEAGFHEERLEMLTEEVTAFRGAMWEVDDEDEA